MSGTCRLDHLAVAAATLEDGAAWVAERLGVAPDPGGAHGRMATHNRLLRLGPGLYLEVIAPDPLAPPPDGPRWFGLDDAATLARGPRLATFIARTAPASLDAVVAAGPPALGTPQPMSRGDLHWRITMPADGSLPEGGVVPTLIAWPEGILHPAERLPDHGLALLDLTLVHPQPERLGAWLDAMGLERVAGEGGIILAAGPRPGLRARLRRPDGREAVL